MSETLSDGGVLVTLYEKALLHFLNCPKEDAEIERLTGDSDDIEIVLFMFLIKREQSDLSCSKK